ncbi:MAG: hypothetical protein KatS3mg087_1838 [Patescibacteria group bacterium]|nr:MAG: hypothetical protein KatS3mg087_1838 [Patescibacteria group bacterium]
MRPKLLDLFCGAGGAGMGYHLAGFDVTGVDIKPQPSYPFRFVQADAFEFLEEFGHEYDVIHASPPCQAHTPVRNINKNLYNRDRYPDLIEQTRSALRETGKIYVIENVVGAPLVNPILLCGEMFGLRVFRHRLFEVNRFILAPPHPKHSRTSTSFGTKKTHKCIRVWFDTHLRCRSYVQAGRRKNRNGNRLDENAT